jgi:hypothetical protein
LLRSKLAALVKTLDEWREQHGIQAPQGNEKA